MAKQKVFRCLCFVFLCLIHVASQAKEITLPHNGVTLNAALDLAADKKLKDGIVLITHGALAHRDMEMLVYLRKLLNEMGQSTLAINLSLGVNNRHGMYDCKVAHRHHNEDAIREINFWVQWLGKQGVKDITLLGHSRGGAQTALYAARHNVELIKSIVLMAPATRDNTNATAYETRYKQPFTPVFEKATRLVATGKGNTILDNINLMTCRDTPVMASTFLSYYGRESQVDGPSYLKHIQKPVLVIVGGKDNVVVGLEKKILPLVDGNRIKMKVIPGSGHMFRDLNTDDAVDAIVDFLGGIK
jgi:pimeloyl-ACP methyl ester carboxylesterase